MDMGQNRHRSLVHWATWPQMRVLGSAFARRSFVRRFGLMGAAALLVTWAGPARIGAQQRAGAAPATAALVFDGVTVVDVEHGKLVPVQRVVVVGNRIQAVGAAATVTTPAGAQIVDARGKYLIPGLWDMHVHPARATDIAYPLLLAYGITGIRDAGSPVPLDTLHRWRREILAGTRFGPPRQILSGQSITNYITDCDRSEFQEQAQTCVADSADAVHYVDSLKAAGADMIKPRAVSRAMYFVIAAAARRLRIPFGGHVPSELPELDASDSGATIIDHRGGDAGCTESFGRPDSAVVDSLGLGWEQDLLTTKDKGYTPGDTTVESCWRQAAERFRRNGTWFVPTVYLSEWRTVQIRRFGVPLLAGTDSPTIGDGYGVSLHDQLHLYVRNGLTPLDALQSATLNPARMLHATDSLGTVAVGKLADLVLLDADPLADITNTTKIRAVVANGRYLNRATLDKLLGGER